LKGVEGSSTTESALNLIENERGLMLIGEGAAFAEKLGRTFQNSAFAENRLEHDGAGVGIDGSTKRVQVVARDEGHVFKERFEALAVFVLPGERHGTESSAVVGTLESNETRLSVAASFVAGKAGEFDRTLNGFGTAVGEKDAVEAGKLAEPLGELALIFVVVKVGKMNDAGRLLANCFYNARMGMAESVDAESSDKIEVLFALEVIQENAFATLKSDRIPVISWKKEALFEIGNLFEARHT
jgi:hypothetical protein